MSDSSCLETRLNKNDFILKFIILILTNYRNILMKILKFANDSFPCWGYFPRRQQGFLTPKIIENL